MMAYTVGEDVTYVGPRFERGHAVILEVGEDATGDAGEYVVGLDHNGPVLVAEAELSGLAAPDDDGTESGEDSEAS